MAENKIYEWIAQFGGDDLVGLSRRLINQGETIKQIVPAAFQNNPLARLLAKSVLTIQQLGELVKKMQAEKAIAGNGHTGAVKPNEDQRKAGPTASSMAAADNTKSGNDVTFDDFKETKISIQGEATEKEITICDKSDIELYFKKRKLSCTNQINEAQLEFETKKLAFDKVISNYETYTI